MSLRKGSTMRRFERVEGSSSKFWEVEVAGSELTVRFGRIGTAGQAKTKALASQAAAEKERDALVKEKVGKGYVETSAVTLAAAPGAAPTARPAPRPAQMAPTASAAPVPARAPAQLPAAQAPAAVADHPAAPLAAAPIEWPQGGFQWTDGLRAELPLVRGIQAGLPPATDDLWANTIVLVATSSIPAC
jgi:predicted DNA-binding WGR domain protein